MANQKPEGRDKRHITENVSTAMVEHQGELWVESLKSHKILHEDIEVMKCNKMPFDTSV